MKKNWIIVPIRAAASSCQIMCAGMPPRPSSISCQADLAAWEQATQLTMLIIKSTEYLTHALSFELWVFGFDLSSAVKFQVKKNTAQTWTHVCTMGAKEPQRALLDQPLQPLTANTPWQWWSETPIVLWIAKNTRCVTQWRLYLLASELKSMFQ